MLYSAAKGRPPSALQVARHEWCALPNQAATATINNSVSGLPHPSAQSSAPRQQVLLPKTSLALLAWLRAARSAASRSAAPAQECVSVRVRVRVRARVCVCVCVSVPEAWTSC